MVFRPFQPPPKRQLRSTNTPNMATIWRGVLVVSSAFQSQALDSAKYQIAEQRTFLVEISCCRCEWSLRGYHGQGITIKTTRGIEENRNHVAAEISGPVAKRVRDGRMLADAGLAIDPADDVLHARPRLDEFGHALSGLQRARCNLWNVGAGSNQKCGRYEQAQARCGQGH